MEIFMNLGKKIIILATLVVLGMQTLSCVLEIGFLYRKIEGGYLTKYKLSGTAIVRKLERSLLYGKKIDKLNYNRLLKGLVPKDASGITINDATGKELYALNDVKIAGMGVINKSDVVLKKKQYYAMAFPIYQVDEFKGNMFVFISDRGIRDKIMPIIKDVVVKFIVIFVALIFMLYIILHIFMEKPFGVYINNLREAIEKKDISVLSAVGVNMGDYSRVEALINKLKGVKWLELKKSDNTKLNKAEQEFVLSNQQLWSKITEDVYQKHNYSSPAEQS